MAAAALAERLTAYRDGRAPAFPVVSEGESRTVERVPVEPRVAAARVLHLRDLHLCDTWLHWPRLHGQSLARGGSAALGPHGSRIRRAAELLRYIEGAKAGDRAHLVILFRRLLKKRAGFNDELSRT
eukprot:tig00000911_g5397.t1